MARFVITYDGTSLQTSNIVIQTIQHEDVMNKVQDIQLLGRADGGKIVSVLYKPKIIRLKGTLTGSSQANLETRLDALKALINRQQKNLDVGYAGGTRRYVTSMSAFTLERMHHNLTYVEFEAEFVVSNTPFGKGLDSATFSYTIGTTGTYSGTATFIGNARPLPIIKVTVTSQSNLTSITFRNKNTGDSITIRRTFATNDVIIIDTQGFTVTVNGVAADYEGFFPEFVAEANDFAITPYGSNCTLAVKLIYNQQWL